MIVTDEMVEQAAIAGHVALGGTERGWRLLDVGARARDMVRARATLDAVASCHDTAREERLKDYRCAAVVAFGAIASANEVEGHAHAMLAAERPADAPARDERLATVSDDLIAALEKNRDLTRAGIREALDVLDVDIPDIGEVAGVLRALLPTDKETA